jgi:Rad3-related DNA helicase
VTELLAAAVAGIGGVERPGQVAMAEAVRRAIETGEHLAVQAGTGTGKSLAYLVPAIRHALTTRSTVVVATATIALQRQLIDRDLPRLVTALAPLLGQEPAFAILKGRRNYLCLYRQRGGPADDPQDSLFEPVALVPRPRWAGRSSGCTSGPRKPSPGTATNWSPGSPKRPGARSRSARRNASAPPAARSARAASPRRPGKPRPRRPSWSPTTR